jgi:tetratricopeptide (TPR) repeat protein
MVLRVCAECQRLCGVRMPEVLSKRVLNWVLVCVVFVITLWAIWQAQRVMRADFLSLQARYRIDLWSREKARWTVAEWIEARDDLLTSADVAPDNPLTFDYLGLLNALRGKQAWDTPALRHAYFSEAMAFQRRSLQLRPENGAAWANLALSQFALDDHAGAIASMRSALKFGPYELPVKLMSSELVLAMWAEAPTDMKDWLLSRHKDGQSDERRDIERIAKRYGLSLPQEALLHKSPTGQQASDRLSG